MALHHGSERDRIEAALASGRLTVEDVQGFQHGLYTVCSEDHTRAHPHRTQWTRDGSGQHIQQIIFRCHSCGRRWSAPLEDMHLA